MIHINIIRADYKKTLFSDFKLDRHKIIKIKQQSDLIKGQEKASFIMDGMFKAMLQTQSNIKYSAKLLSYILNISYEDLLNNLILIKNELDKDNINTDTKICDYVGIYKNLIINIEMNNTHAKNILIRNLEYCHRMSTNSHLIKETEKYHQVIQINLCNFSFKDIDEVMYVSSDENYKFRATNNVITIYIFIPNIYYKLSNYGAESLNELERFILTMACENIEEAKKYAKEDELMNEYISESIDVSFLKNIGTSYDRVIAAEQSGREDGLEEGIEQGIEQGRAEGNKKATEKFILTLHDNGFKVEDISRYVKASTEYVEQTINNSKKDNKGKNNE